MIQYLNLEKQYLFETDNIYQTHIEKYLKRSKKYFSLEK